MFSGIWVRSFPPETDSEVDVCSKLAGLGTVTTGPSVNMLEIAHGLDGFGYKFIVLGGQHVQPDGSVRVTVNYSARPAVIAWILAICFFPIGLLIFLLPYQAKQEFEARLTYV